MCDDQAIYKTQTSHHEECGMDQFWHAGRYWSSGGNSKRGTVVKFGYKNQEVNTMENHVDPIPRNKKERKVATKKCKIKSIKISAVERGHTCGIVRPNLVDTAYAENEPVQGKENPNGHESEWILAHILIG